MRKDQTAPDFELPDQDGKPWRLSEALADGPVALFFYPAANTPICTKQACHFRNLSAEFAAAGVQRVGISRDQIGVQAGFSARFDLDYPLLADVDGAVASAYGVRRALGGIVLPTKRWTFAIAQDGRIADVISSELNATVHADRALAALSQA
ncbi:peroxiredoxin [Nocardioides jejuensis]|uniref:thioredoxin-dependent peroxiredoxin n=1 Tax=Nocardioides jejuensis TaxID=2502782 RepID=A0A4R1CB37_9ACTN|nr:peroxiredoxin [Nocardioides jejuensis]TCJ28283.1 peroxiredoxin [Nocardioides jejuensis]